MAVPITTEELVPLLYEELRAQASRYARGSGEVSPTSVVHEAFLKLRGAEPRELEHFRALAAKAMRQVLVDRARKRATSRRGGDLERVTMSVALDEAHRGESCDVEALDAALTRLEQLDVRQARIVELRYFAGLTVEEVARELSVSTSTVEKEWRRARAWLGAQLQG